MSLACIHSFVFNATETVPIEVQVEISLGLRAFVVVGLADATEAETRKRVRAALSALGLSLPPGSVLVSLAPTNSRNDDGHLDLPIALAVLAAMDIIDREDASEYAAIGRLSSQGDVTAVTGVLPAAIAASAAGLGLICPAGQGGEAAWAGRTGILPAPNLLSIVNHFQGTQVLSPPELPVARGPQPLSTFVERRVRRAANDAPESTLIMDPDSEGLSSSEWSRLVGFELGL